LKSVINIYVHAIDKLMLLYKVSLSYWQVITILRVVMWIWKVMVVLFYTDEC